MACSACGNKRTASSTQEYLVTLRNGETKRVSDLTEVRKAITLGGGGTYKMVDKTTK